jgi:hypothetical protein
MIPTKAPPEAVLRELRVGELSPVAFNKLWLFSISLLLNLSFCVTPTFEQNYFKCLCGILILIFSYVLFTFSENELEKFPVFGNILLSFWYLYGFLQWGGNVKYHVIIGLASLLVTAGYFIEEYIFLRTNFKKTIFYTQLALFIFPVNTASSLETGDIVLTCLFFLICWWSYWIVGWIIFGPPFDLEKAFMAICPLLRLNGGYLVLFYTGIFELSLFFLFWIQGPSISPVSDLKTNIQQGDEEEDKAFLHSTESPHDEIDVDEEEFLNHKHQEKEEKPLPQLPQPPPPILKKQSRFKVLPPLKAQTPINFQSSFVRTVDVRPQPQQKFFPSSSVLGETIIERLGGNKLKSLYGGESSSSTN